MTKAFRTFAIVVAGALPWFAGLVTMHQTISIQTMPRFHRQGVGLSAPLRPTNDPAKVLALGFEPVIASDQFSSRADFLKALDLPPDFELNDGEAVFVSNPTFRPKLVLLSGEKPWPQEVSVSYDDLMAVSRSGYNEFTNLSVDPTPAVTLIGARSGDAYAITKIRGIPLISGCYTGTQDSQMKEFRAGYNSLSYLTYQMENDRSAYTEDFATAESVVLSTRMARAKQ